LSGVDDKVILLNINKGNKMTYSRKHFRDISSVISLLVDELPEEDFLKVVKTFSEFFKKENKNFREKQFSNACVPPLGG
jgi:hypothetical protein